MNYKGDYYRTLRKYAVYIFLTIACFVVVHPTASNAYTASNKRKSISIGPDTVKTGTIKFNTKADTIFIYVDKNYDRLVTLTTNKKLSLNVGEHWFFVFGKNFPEHEYFINIKEDKTITLALPPLRKFHDWWSSSRSAYASLRWNANLVIETDRETSVWIDNELIGNGFIKQTLPAGTYRVSFRRTHREKRKSIFVTVRKHRLSYIKYFFLPSATVAKDYAFWPGASQLYKHQYLKGSALMLTTALAAVLGVSSNSKFLSRKQEYYRVRKNYLVTSDEHLALEYGNRLDELNNSTKKYQRRRNLFLITTGVLYVLNIYDAFQRPRSGYRRSDILNPFKDFRISLSDNNLSLAIKMRF